ncbi:MAG: protein kinase [Acetobacteraceae bacterium]
MGPALSLSIGQHSAAGRKAVQQDFHGALIPEPPLLVTKGIAVALADGISSSPVSRIASESAVKSFLTDYYCTSETWSVKTSAQRVIAATNAWLHAQTRRGPHAHDADRGHVCTLTVMIFKARSAHIFHIGDSRVYRLAGDALEQLTTDHRVVLSSQETYLARALGMQPQVEIDYQLVPLEPGDVFVLTTDGVHEHVDAATVAAAIRAGGDDLDGAARAVAEAAFRRGSPDNLTVQIVRVDALPAADADDILGRIASLPPPPLPSPRDRLDGYEIIRELHASSRSHIYLAKESETDTLVALKVPSLDLRDDAAYLRRFMLEEWVARRISSAHVLKARPPLSRRGSLYLVAEYVDGQTLQQWVTDHPRPDLETVRGILEQIARGLRAFDRLEMLHQDLRPANVMIDRFGTVKIIDFGSARIPGVMEAAPDDGQILGTVQYTAPEYLLGEPATERSDLFSLGVIAYQMLTGALPYGTRMAAARTRARQRKVPYVSARQVRPDLPAWIDGALRKAVHPDPAQRYEAETEFLRDLRHPNPAFTGAASPPLLERNPLLFWQVLAALLAAGNIVLLGLR